jgi:hypothetical protein
VAFSRSLALATLATALVWGEDPVAALSHRQLPFDGTYGYLPALLEALHVPVESQMAVFSKTSIQSLRIEPSNPRVLYFNDSVAVGWVRGGFIELTAQDPATGIRFYTLQQRADEVLTRREDCLRCHKSGNTLVRSVTSAPYGIPSDEIDTDSRTPFAQLWGGWYVTGNVGAAHHRGNAVFANAERRELTPALDPRVALTSSSDAVALLVFGHQMRMMNLLAHPDNINELVDYMLFVDEAPLPGKVEGSSGFAEKFTATGPRDSKGRSLRQFDLEHRLMRYPCSYMIYTAAFEGMAADTKDSVYRRMWQILSGQILSGKDRSGKYSHLSHDDRRAVVEILRETKSDLPDYFRQTIK